ncbi:PspC domain-containing protein [Amphibacillus cookii]|uniref:PspC domain-containing protein n=1 Tax=Amphibacillus cookii TaxID=767787 RepID=UPI00195A888B|nr:PspC domain-containing protein [Amphibacillus cookii]MBM7541533.1 phage shock protein C [Amphibacillus cookii]
MTKKLTRSNQDVMVSGVLGGLGEHLNVDPTLLRLVYVLLAIFTSGFPFILFYIIAAIIIPKSDVY